LELNVWPAGEVGLPLKLYAESWSTLKAKPVSGVGKQHVSNASRTKNRAVPKGFYYNAILKMKRAPRPDFDKVKGGALFMSRKMIDLLHGFDLGNSTILELLLFDGKEQGKGKHPYSSIGPNYDLPFPDRSGLFHLMARKMSCLAEASENISGPAKGPRVQTYSRKDHRVPLVLALDADKARAGADFWIEAQFSDRIFCSDRLMQAMKAEDIDSPMVEFSERARLD
jgi:hypothetical protein